MIFSHIIKYGIAVAASGTCVYVYKNEWHDIRNRLISKSYALVTTVEATRWNENWDRRAHETPTATRHLILVRHGEEVDKYLTNLGREQAVLTGQRLKALGFDKKINKVVESSMARAKETNMLICRELDLDESSVEIESSDLLKTGSPIEPDPHEECGKSAFKPQAFFVDGARIETAFRQFIHRADAEQEKDSVELFVSHGNVICYFVCRALQLPLEALLRMCVGHASITQLYIWPNGRVFLKGLGDVGHIPGNKVTYE